MLKSKRTTHHLSHRPLIRSFLRQYEQGLIAHHMDGSYFWVLLFRLNKFKNKRRRNLRLNKKRKYISLVEYILAELGRQGIEPGDVFKAWKLT